MRYLYPPAQAPKQPGMFSLYPLCAMTPNKKVGRRSPQQRANLRTCASCEWVFRGHARCPKCGFATYGARWVYGDVCYKYEHTQEPWMDRKLARFRSSLLAEIQTISNRTNT